MSNVLKGAKSKLYLNNDNIPGIADSSDNMQHVTVQEIEGQRAGMDVVIHGKYPVIPSIAVAAGSVRRKIVLPAHGLPIGKKGLFLKPLNGNAEGEEVAILTVVDANTVVIAAEINMAVGDLVEVARYITPNYTEDGDLNVVVNAAGPAQFMRDAAIETVTEDTAVAANNKPMPSGMFIAIDGVAWPVGKDTTDPTNTVSVPVEVTGASGPINITAGDINVQLTDSGPNPDIVKVGNGANRLDINANNEALVHDTDSLAKLGDLESELIDVNTELDTQTTKLTSIDSHLSFIESNSDDTVTYLNSLVNIGAKEAKQDTQITRLNLLATEAKQDAEAVLLGAVTEAAPASDTASSGLNGRLQRIAQRLTSLIALFPTSLGQKTMANSFAVAIASDQPALIQKTSALTASYSENVSLSAVNTLTAPANCVGGKIYADDANTASIRWKQGAAATASSGFQLQSGRGEDFGNGSNISVCPESGTQKVYVIWNIQA